MAANNNSVSAHSTGRPATGRTAVLSPHSTGMGAISGRGSAGGESIGQQMSVLLSWHEKVVEVAGHGCVVRAMSDRRQV
jgi:actin related protein 2/3 complex subunit 5